MFNGSYNSDDVTFLLKKIELSSTSVEEKERNIQKGKAHYSEMITHEKAPKKEYIDIFYDAVELNGEKFSYHIWLLAQKILKDYHNNQEIVLVSLARAGTPVGVLLNRLLKKITDKKITHYSISIIRDRGVDSNAISFILNKHKDTDIIFLDGWTGKGVIGQELKESIGKINKKNNVNISSNLYVVADISGTAYWSATDEDYLLPSAVLNSTVSGLVSRTILKDDYIGTNDFHGCLYYEELKKDDLSLWFIDKILNIILTKMEFYEIKDFNLVNKEETKNKSIQTIEYFLNKYNFNNRNFIKPGVGESTRVLLRRIPKEIWIKDINDVSLKHIVFLAKNKNIPLHINSELSYNAIAVIDEVD